MSDEEWMTREDALHEENKRLRAQVQSRKVWVLLDGVTNEGGYIRGVYTNREDAERAQEVAAAERVTSYAAIGATASPREPLSRGDARQPVDGWSRIRVASDVFDVESHDIE